MSSMTLTGLFDEVARARPSDIAVVSSRGRCTYAELRRRADQIARALRALGIAREAPVGVRLPRSLESVAAILGVLRAGGAYVPIDPAYPPERQRLMASDAGLRAIVIASELAPSLEGLPDIPVVDISALPSGADDAPLDLPEQSPDDLLYILYTSGSTGRPKGVCGTHAATLNRLRWGWEAFPFADGEVVGHRSSLSFVDAAPEVFSGLLRGAPTAVILPDELADFARLVAALRRHRVTRLTVVPSILAALVRAMPDLGAALGDLRHWITSGEELTLPLLRAFRAAHPAATLVNLYGTTEVTGDVTCAVFAPGAPLPEGRAPIGAAIAGAELLILDEHGLPVPDGEAGELHVAGPVLARGYHHRPQEEAVRFPRRPTHLRERVFKTGDRVRRGPDGALDYLGRADDLVKLRGVRVELGEVERCLRAACPSLGDIAAVPAEGGERLVAFVAPLDVDLDALRAAAARALPSVMNPGRYVPIDSLPLLPNGKIDRRALAARVSAPRRELPMDRRPATPTERRVASLWAPLIKRDDIARDDTFSSLGGDSLALAELLLAFEQMPGAARIELGLARDGTLKDVARALDGGEAPLDAVVAPLGGSVAPLDDSVAPLDEGAVHAAALPGADQPSLTLSPLGEEGARDADVVAMLVEASMDAALCAATELPGHMDTDRARAYCAASDGVVLRVDGQPAGAGIVQHHPNVGEGVAWPPGSVQLDEWLLARWRGRGILGEAGAWPLLLEWLARRFDHEVSVVWEDHLAMLAILRARGYTRIGRSYWKSAPDGDGTEGFCEVWIYDLRPHRRAR